MIVLLVATLAFLPVAIDSLRLKSYVCLQHREL